MMKSFNEIRSILEAYKHALGERFKVKEIGLFGSYVREEQTEESDIDMLVELEEEGKTFDNYMDLTYFLQEILGLEVDLVMKSALKNELRDVILGEVVYLTYKNQDIVYQPCPNLKNPL